MIRNALSFELEDWFHAEFLSRRLTTEPRDSRLAWAIEPILLLLQRYRARATFFVVGDVLRHQPELVRRIYAEGHEIGCHGWSHRPLWGLDPEQLARELQQFDESARGIVPPERIIGFRAPAFSLDQRTSWAIDVLRQHGYRYDSSLFPVRTWLYGVADGPTRPYHPTSHELTTEHGGSDFLEFPLTVCPLLGLPLPVAGGFYLRALPLGLVSRLLQRLNERGDPFVLYLHPWETDVLTPRIRGLSLMARMLSFHNGRVALRKLETLLQRFSFGPLRDVLGIRGGRNRQP